MPRPPPARAARRIDAPVGSVAPDWTNYGLSTAAAAGQCRRGPAVNLAPRLRRHGRPPPQHPEQRSPADTARRPLADDPQKRRSTTTAAAGRPRYRNRPAVQVSPTAGSGAGAGAGAGAGSDVGAGDSVSWSHRGVAEVRSNRPPLRPGRRAARLCVN